MALPGRKLRYTKWLNLRQLLEPSGREVGCGSEDFGLKMTEPTWAELKCRSAAAPCRIGTCYPFRRARGRRHAPLDLQHSGLAEGPSLG